MTSWCEISTGALRANVQALRSLVHPAKFLAVAKANAYGHGMIEVASAIEDLVDIFGVAHSEEALNLRAQGIRKPILVLGFVPDNHLAELIQEDVALTIISKAALRDIENAARQAGKRTLCHLKIETGLGRFGVLPKELPEILTYFQQNASSLHLSGLYSHFAAVEEAELEYTRTQYATFLKATEKVKGQGIVRHIAASAAAINLPKTRLDLCRFGIACYGLWPSEETRLLAQNHRETRRLVLTPALAFKSRIAHIARPPIGSSIGYGRAFRVVRPMRTAVIPVGYADGFDRGFGNIGEVLIGGRRARIVGRVFMNFIIADISHLTKVGIDDEVVLLGRQGSEEITAEEWAEKLGTITYEVVTRIPEGVPRLAI